MSDAVSDASTEREDEGPWTEAELTRVQWYHGFITRHLVRTSRFSALQSSHCVVLQAGSLLRDSPEGSYLLRRRQPASDDDPITFALSLKSTGAVHHLLIVPNAHVRLI